MGMNGKKNGMYLDTSVVLTKYLPPSTTSAEDKLSLLCTRIHLWVYSVQPTGKNRGR